jgi:histidine triad (HIT) family protein
LETPEVVAFMDLRQPRPGHVLVVPRAHYAGLPELPPELAAALMQAAQRVAGALYRTLYPDGISLTLADRAAAGQELMHVHLHLQPRAAGDGLLTIKAGEPSDPAALEALAVRIRTGLQE